MPDHRKVVGLLTIVGLLLMTLFSAGNGSAPVMAATSVNENFEDGVANGFSVATGTYAIVTDGTKVYKTTSAAARAVVGDSASTNVNVQADVKVASWSASSGRTVGLLARYTNTNNYYLFIYEDGSLYIKKKVAGTLTNVASKAYTFNTGAWYTFKGVVNGTTLTMYVNGVQELTGTATGLTAGKVGLISFNGDVRNDNFVASDIAGPTATSTYTPTPGPTNTPTPTATNTPGSGTVELPVAAVTASTYEAPNVPAHAIDNNLSTRWSAEGDGQWIQFDLGGAKNVEYVDIAFYNGNTRQAAFDIQVSADAVNWTPVFSGQSSGTTTALERFDVTDASGWYVRIVGHGNTSNDWNSYTEVDIYGNSGAPLPTNTPTPTPTPTRTPTATATSTGGSLDPFGLKKLYPSVGKEWFNVWNSGADRIYTTAGNQAVDPELGFANGDQTAEIYGGSGARAGQMKIHGEYPRVYVRKNESFNIPPGIPAADKWNNVEITFYAYSTGDSGVGWAGLEAVAKTNHWPDDWQCTTGGYGARMLFDGRVNFEKELYHTPNTNFQAGSISNYWTAAEGSVGGKLPLNRWIGFKFVARNIDAGNDGDWHNDTQVKLELYKEMSIGNVVNPTPPAGGGNWVLVTQYTDTGNWSSGSPCTHQSSPDDDPYGSANLAFTWPNYSIYLRTDGLTSSIPQYYKWFSVREVAPIPGP